MTAGIYLITNLVTNYRYIGRSDKLESRIKSSRQNLAAGRHTNKRLQTDWQTYGASAFEFVILEEVDLADCRHKLAVADKLKQFEQCWIEKLQPEYNVLKPRCRIIIKGIYLMTNRVTGDRYVGQTIDMVQRWKLHQKQMAEGTHPNRFILELVQAHGSESFSFEVLEVYREKANHQLKWLELKWIKQLNPELNFRGGERGRVCQRQWWTAERRQRSAERAKELWRRRKAKS